MRSSSIGFVALLSLPFLAAACSAGRGSSDSSSAADTQEDAARAALRPLGAKVLGAQGNCNQCHDVNKATLKHWADSYKKTLAVLQDTTKSVDERINSMRRDPSDPQSGFAPAKLGFLTAGAHLGTSGLVNPTKEPLTFAQGKMLKELFAGKDDVYARFKDDARMPIEPTFDRLSASDYEAILSWVQGGMPKLEQLLQEEARPTTCTDDFAGLTQYVRASRSATWAAVNKDGQMPMFACDASGDPLACFGQTFGDKPIFPDAKTTTFAATWADTGSTVRVLRELGYHTFFWMRSSADGQFVSNGGGPRIDGAGAVIADLGAALDPAGPRTRDIEAMASYDPDFSPHDDWFMFQGTSRGGVACSMNLLRNAATTRVTFIEPQCSKLDSIGLYQTVGQVIGDNSIGDSFVVNNKFSSDNPGLTASDHDLDITAGPDAKMKIAVAIPRGNDADQGYQVNQVVELPAPFKGDTMMARSGGLLGSRVAGESGPLGYAIDKLTFTKGSQGYQFTIRQLGRVCMPGNKANFSFDERFLATHHYEAGKSDIWVADFVTGTKTQVTHMAQGQFALYPHVRSDGWLYFLVRDGNARKEYVAASDWTIRAVKATP